MVSGHYPLDAAVASALWQEANCPGTWESGNPMGKKKFVALARAAIDAFIKASSTEDGGEAEIRERHEIATATDAHSSRIVRAIRGRMAIEDRATLLSTTAALRARQSTLFDAIQHGDDEHRAWLKQAIDDHLAGKPVEAPRGSGRKEAEIETLRSRVGELETKNAALSYKVREVTTALDQQWGTPCEQIRHKQEVEALQSDIEQMRKALDEATGFILGAVERAKTTRNAPWFYGDDLVARLQAALTHVPSHTVEG